MLKIRFQTIVLALVAVAVAVAGGLLNPKNSEKASAASFYTLSDNTTGGSCTSIGTWNRFTKTCTLNQNISLTSVGSDYGIEIVSPSLTLDCDGHSITATGSVGVFSSGVSTGSSNVIIKNCSISNFVNQIFFQGGSTNAGIYNNTLSGGSRGIWTMSTGAYIVKNTIQSASSMGIDTYGSSNYKYIFGNTVTTSQIGLLLESGGDEIVGNTFSSNYDGIQALGAQTNAIIKGNTVQNNTHWGIYLLNLTGTNNTMNANIVTGNATSDIVNNGSTVTGTNNTCSTYSAWNDSGYTGCRWTSLPAQPTCGASLTQNTKLTGNLTGCTGHGLLFGANNITLDCAGFMLTAPTTGWRGINQDSTTDAVIKNCTINGFTWGTYMNGSSYTINVNATNGTGALWNEFYSTGGGTGGPSVIGSTAATRGIRVDNSVNARVIFNTSAGLGDGISVITATGIQIRGNTSTSSNYGIGLSSSTGGTISDNRISGGPYYGIQLSSGTSNTFSRNFVTNSGYGLNFSTGVTGNTVGGTATTGNVILNNTYNDISDAVLGNNSGQYNICDVVSLWRDTGLGANGCTYNGCGDGFINGTDVCDDGNNNNGDGCSSTCTVESGWGCVGEPSSCQLGGGKTTSASVSNTGPSFSVSPSDGGSDVSAPTNVGSNVTFTATATDPNYNQYYLAVCKYGFAKAGNDAAPSCCTDGTLTTCTAAEQWGISAVANNGIQATATYTAILGNPSSNNWFAFVCDKVSGGGSCSAYSQGSGVTGSPFEVNHAPTYFGYSVTDATGGSIEPGDNVKFTLTTADADSDTVAVWVCAGGDTFTGSACSSYRFCSTSSSLPGVVSCTSLSPLAVPTAHGSYNVEVFVMDGHNFVGNLSSTQSYSVTDVAPTINGTGQYSVSAITLTAGGTSAPSFTVTATDNNGGNDLTGSTAVLYDTNGHTLSGGTCNGGVQADTWCYPNSVCSPGTPSGTNLTYTCAWSGANAIWFNANASSTWAMHANPTDQANSPTALTDSSLFTVNALSGLNIVSVPESSIAYGAVFPGADSAAIPVTMQNMGNVIIDVMVSGDNIGASSGKMCASYPSCVGNSIPVAQQKLSGTSGFDWATQGSALVAYPPSASTAATGCLNTDSGIRSPSHTSTNSDKTLYWKLRIPSGQASGTYTGANLFTSTINSTCSGSY